MSELASSTASTPPPVVRRNRSGSIIFLNNPHASLDISLPTWDPKCTSTAVKNNAKIIETIKLITSKLCPMMKDLDAGSIEISQLGGGLTNVLYLVTGQEVRLHGAAPPSSGEKTREVTSLVRVNGSSAEVTAEIQMERDIENVISSFLSRHGVAPLYFGRFQNGRVEEFHAGSSTLEWSEMGATAEQVSEKEVIVVVCFLLFSLFSSSSSFSSSSRGFYFLLLVLSSFLLVFSLHVFSFLFSSLLPPLPFTHIFSLFVLFFVLVSTLCDLFLSYPTIP